MKIVTLIVFITALVAGAFFAGVNSALSDSRSEGSEGLAEKEAQGKTTGPSSLKSVAGFELDETEKSIVTLVRELGVSEALFNHLEKYRELVSRSPFVSSCSRASRKGSRYFRVIDSGEKGEPFRVFCYAQSE